MTLLRDLIDIPDHVHKGDFVLRLADGVRDPAATLRDYVVTEQILSAFGQALKLVRGAVETQESKAAFLHGSFGSGKSHFMAVLHLLLAQDRGVRSHSDLAPVVAAHRWLEGKKFLLVPFHMIGARSLEHAIFSQYLAHTGQLHPTAPVPAVFLGEKVLEQAEVERRRDENAFLQKLGSGSGEWGTLDAWTADRYQRARAAAPNDPERLALISAVVTHYLPAYHQVVGADGGEGYLSLDVGLPILCQHAKDLGYDCLVFFLDEVILWLATMSADLQFVNRESAKLAKLIESQGVHRVIPLVSLLARQRDLRELVGDHIPGAEKLGFLDVINWGGGRFDTIKLEDRNLPAIVEKRLLRTKGESARQQLDSAFAQTQRVRREIFDTLLTGNYAEGEFRRVYPFSPALIETLVAASSLLQRERTAIKVLMQLLVDQRDALELGQLVPLGDLYDVIADGDEPFTPEMRQNFESAKKLYHQKLQPRILADRGLTHEQLRALPAGDARRREFRNDDRLVKTLLLAALVSVEPLKNMTAGRLVALNHGTIRAPIPGQETSLVLTKLKNWSADVGELRLQGDQANPTITLAIIGVDTESILQKARQSVDNVGNRKAKIREVLFAEMAIEVKDELWSDYRFVWRGTRRTVQVVYGNVRELPAESLRASGGDWRIVIDYPFDEGHTPDEDLQKLESFRQRENTKTVCWVPAFLSRDRMSDLGVLVALDYVLQNSQRFADHASHLPPAERAQAESLLRSQQSQLRARVVQALEMAYGIQEEKPGMLGPSLEVAERFQCLHAAQCTMNRPVAPNLRVAMVKLADQMLAIEYPRHPVFDLEIKGAVLRRVFEWVQRAAREPMHRAVVDPNSRREVKAVVEPLELATMGEDAIVLGEYWRSHFDRQAALQRGEPITVSRLRAWTDRPEARGLPAEVQNLLILTYAELTNRRFFQHGGGVSVGIDDRLDDALELREQPLPSEAQWQRALDRAQRTFGVVVGRLLSASNVGDLIEKVRFELKQRAASARQLVGDLRARLQSLGMNPNDAPRWNMATAVATLCDALERATDDLFVERLAAASTPGSWEAMGVSLKQAEPVRQVLQQTRWETLENAWGLGGNQAGAARDLRSKVVAAVSGDELAEPLAPALRALETEASALIRQALHQAPPVTTLGGVTPLSPSLPNAPPPSTAVGARVVEAGERGDLSAAGLRDLLAALERKLQGNGRVAHLSWRIEEKDGSA
ncbi:MAG: phage resistance protein [Planctomycetota bacterium]